MHTCGRRRRRHRRVPGGAAGPRVTAAHRQTRIGAPGAASGRWTTLKMSISHAARSPGEGALTNEREAASRRAAAPPAAACAAHAQHTPAILPQPARPSPAAVARMQRPLRTARAGERPSRLASSGELDALPRRRVRRQRLHSGGERGGMSRGRHG